MPRAILELTTDPETGHKTLRIHYLSDPDALPMEHEEAHGVLVGQVIPGAECSRDGGSISNDSGGGEPATPILVGIEE